MTASTFTLMRHNHLDDQQTIITVAKRAETKQQNGHYLRQIEEADGNGGSAVNFVDFDSISSISSISSILPIDPECPLELHHRLRCRRISETAALVTPRLVAAAGPVSRCPHTPRRQAGCDCDVFIMPYSVLVSFLHRDVGCEAESH